MQFAWAIYGYFLTVLFPVSTHASFNNNNDDDNNNNNNNCYNDDDDDDDENNK